MVCDGHRKHPIITLVPPIEASKRTVMLFRVTATIISGISLLASCSNDAAPKPTSTRGVAVAPEVQSSTCIPPAPVTARERADLVGQILATAARKEAATGHKIRALGEDGKCADAHDDLNPKRVNVVIQNGKIIWAMMY